MINVDQINPPGQDATVADGEGWMTSGQACERLGVRPQTLYAYVSRGLLRSVKLDGRSRYDPVQVDALARRTARGRRPGRFEVTVDTEVTRLARDGRCWYRGVDVADLIGRWSFERTAEWLWSGVDRGEPERPWAPDPVALARSRAAVAALDAAGCDGDGAGAGAVSPGDRLRTAVAALGVGLAPSDPAARAPAAARTLVATLVEALPRVGPAPRRDASIAARLWPRLAPRRPTAAEVAALDGVLVAMADHELATSTLAVRVATSTGAGLDAALLAGLATLSGPLHGAAAGPVRDLLVDARARGAAVAVEAAVAGGRRAPGTGHVVYERVDPRTAPMLAAVAPAVAPARWATVAAVRAELDRRGCVPVNCDFALGAMIEATGMVDGAAEVAFAVARTAGWIAHAREESRHRLRYRARAIYTGPR